jgi:hypothetical protein
MQKYLKAVLTITVLIATGLVSPAFARDSRLEFSIQEALSSDTAVGKINPDIKLYFADEKSPAVIKQFGEYKTNKKTNAFNKSDAVACEWVFLTAVIQMQAKAAELGADAIINIKSNYKNIEYSSSSKYQCGAGGIIAGVALKGDFVKTK